MLYTLRFFSSKCSLFHNVNLFGPCIIHILCTGCAKIKKTNSGAKGLRFPDYVSTAQDGGKVVSLTHRPPLPSGNAPGTQFC